MVYGQGVRNSGLRSTAANFFCCSPWGKAVCDSFKLRTIVDFLPIFLPIVFNRDSFSSCPS